MSYFEKKMKKLYHKIKVLFGDDNTGLKGVLTLKILREGGKWEKIVKENIIVANGLNFFCDSATLSGASDPGKITKMAMGSGTTPATLTDTALQNQLAVQNVSITSNRTAYSFTCTAMFDKGVGTGSISEFGLLTTNNVLIDRIVLSTPIQKNANDIIQGVIEIQFSNLGT